jgi:sugar/nucleoside kinase (ribokinase family)
MNFWIDLKKDALTEVIERVHAVLINEGEIRQYTGCYNVLEAASKIQALGPRYVIIKRGEYGAVMIAGDEHFSLPAYPTFEVRDTTGAGDSFAGGFLGYLDSRASTLPADLRAAAVYGTVVASFTVEDFSVRALIRADASALRERYSRLAHITKIDPPIPLRRRDLVPEGVNA